MDQTFLQGLQNAFPRLAARARLQTDRVSGEPILLYPEGVVLLNGPGASITQLCDGTRSFSTMLNQLAEQYQTEPGAISNDVSAYLFKLHQHSLLEFPDEQEQAL